MFSFNKLSAFALLTVFILSFTLSEAYAQKKKSVEQPETHKLEGKVINAKSGNALNDAKIIVVGKEKETKTSKDGTFAFEKLPEGTHTLKVEKEGYKKWKKKVKLKKGLKVVLQVKPESNY